MPEINEEDLIGPDRCKDEIRRPLKANTAKELRQTGTVLMKIRLRAYRTPINNRKLVEEAVNEMLDSGVIERSRSLRSFPIVIVEKRMEDIDVVWILDS